MHVPEERIATQLALAERLHDLALPDHQNPAAHARDVHLAAAEPGRCAAPAGIELQAEHAVENRARPEDPVLVFDQRPRVARRTGDHSFETPVGTAGVAAPFIAA